LFSPVQTLSEGDDCITPLHREEVPGTWWYCGKHIDGLVGRLSEFHVLHQGGPPLQEAWFPGSSFYLNTLLGPFSAVAGIVASFLASQQTFLTTEFSKWYGESSLVALIAISGLALLGFRLSLLHPRLSNVFKDPAATGR
jgi:hypothetical protein